MQKISTCLWFRNQAEEAANFYVSVFRNSRIVSTSHYGDAGPGPKGSMMIVYFELDGEPFVALNGASDVPFTQAMSLVIYCDTQEEIDDYWSKLTADGGKEVVCGWLTDRFGVSWQVVPAQVPKWISEEGERSSRVLKEVMQMVKLDMAKLQAAYDGK